MKNKRLSVCLLALVLWTGCGPAHGPRISIQWKNPKPEVTEKTPLKYLNITVGEVRRIETDGRGTTANVQLFRKYAHYVKDNGTFLVNRDSDDNTVFIEVRPLKRDAPPAKDGAVFSGAESKLEAGLQELVTDWKRTGVLAGAAVAVILLLVFLIKIFFKLWAWILCLAAGAASAYYLFPLVDQRIQPILPAEVRTDLVAYVVAFLGGFILANIMIGIVFRPLRSRR